MPTNKFLTGSVLTVALLGCGGVSGIPIEKTATEFAKAICPQAYSCCTPETLMGNSTAAVCDPANPPVPPEMCGEAECEKRTAADFRNQLQQMQNSENAGRSKYKQDEVDACLAAIRSATCSELTAIRSIQGLPACDKTFATPMVAVGGKCGFDFECIGGVCQKEPMAWEGVCVAGGATGTACGSNRCAPELICDGKGTSNDPADDVCVAEQDNGATCTDGFECKSRNCSSSGQGGTMTCQPQT